MTLEPEKTAAAPKSETAAAPAPVTLPFFGGKTANKGQGPSGPGEPYTPMPDLSRTRPRWLLTLAALLLALAAATGIFFLREQAAAPATQPANTQDPATPGPQQGN
ncbi:MAG: hypothetical protein A2234_02340 [Elusimicrobia bacterium RIFOXYA2_FULL_58_8]|nr:MAG: hypothetical protein A2285_02305 [Elusimicrobia bacterium RIFOXYA12_FULL_57_11]OGS13152.1 MAG: hypothetical protein A2234_02340 [Elusimicrobia bacterium RIFOXYA2_FULL_58_8]